MGKGRGRREGRERGWGGGGVELHAHSNFSLPWLTFWQKGFRINWLDALHFLNSYTHCPTTSFSQNVTVSKEKLFTHD